jgi:hypothetical protein
MYFIKWLVDLSTISEAVGTPNPCTSETLVIIFIKQKIVTFKL